MLVKRSLKVNAILNGIKQLCAIAFPLISFPYVSRVLGNDSFGRYSFSNSIIGYFTLLAGLGVSSYAVREGAKIRDNSSKLNVFVNEVFSINVLSTILSFIVLLFVLSFDSMQYYRYIILILSLSFVLATIGSDWVNIIFEDYLYITIRYIIFQSAALIILFIFVHKPEDVYWYAIVTVIANSAGNIANIIYIKKYVNKHFVRRINLRKHIKPILILFVNSLALTIYVNSDITMVGVYYSDAQVGIYTLSSKIYNILKNLINAVVLVAVPRLSNVSSNKSEFDRYTTKILSTIFTIMFPLSMGLFLLSENIILLIGGSEYIYGNITLKILCFAILFAIFGSFYTNCFLIVSRNEEYILKATSLAAIINVALNFLFIPALGINGAALTTVIAEAIAFFVEKHFANVKFRKVVVNNADLKSAIAGSFWIVIVYCLLKYIFVIDSNFGMIMTTTVLSVVGYILILYVLGNTLILNIVKKYISPNFYKFWN